MANDQRNLIMLSGLWLNKSQSGEKYMSGSMGIGGKLLMFKNKNKKGDTDPDYYLFLAPKEQRDKGGEDELPF